MNPDDPAFDRRRALAAIAGLGAGAAAWPRSPAAQDCAPAAAEWARGIEGQRRADLGDGRFLNPVLAGDRPDPTLLRVGERWYATFSSFDSVPGLVLWESHDLVNWVPRTAALRTPVGSVWAPELCSHAGRYFLYFHARRAGLRDIYVLHADAIDGPWSEPIALGLPRHIDPGHIVGEDGRRYLFLSGGDRVRLRDDGLALDGGVEHVYDPWRYPEDWVVESFSPEGPKLLRHGEWFYMITAVGGTAGPPTGHMIIAARSRSIHGPWEHAPHNPLVRTAQRSEPWWSRGHGTLVEHVDGSWWMAYHGYERDYWTLGRQMLLDPVRWRDDGWFDCVGGDLGKPLSMPRPARAVATAPAHGLPLSDDFREDRLGVAWSFYDPAADETQRLRRVAGQLEMRGKGRSPADASPLCVVAGDRAFSVEVDIDVDDACTAGLLMFYSRRLYCGLGFDAQGFVLHRYGLERRSGGLPAGTRSLRLRMAVADHVVTLYHRVDAGPWVKFGVQIEVSGYHHNVAGDFLSLRPAIYAAGAGLARFRDFRYQALPA